MVGLEKPHLLHGGTELTEIFYQLFLWGDPKATTGQKMLRKMKRSIVFLLRDEKGES